MYPEHRLRHRADFERARRQGRSWADRLLVLVAARNDLPRTRCGFLVSGRLGTAVVRTRVRRRLREIMRRALAAVEPGWDLVLVARPPAASAGYQELASSATQLLARAGLTTGAPRGGHGVIEEREPGTRLGATESQTSRAPAE